MLSMNSQAALGAVRFLEMELCESFLTVDQLQPYVQNFFILDLGSALMNSNETCVYFAESGSNDCKRPNRSWFEDLIF